MVFRGTDKIQNNSSGVSGRQHLFREKRIANTSRSGYITIE